MADGGEETMKVEDAQESRAIPRESQTIPATAHRSVFHLDCTALFPDCRFECANCLQEIHSVFAQIPGVDCLRMEGEGAEARLSIIHDPVQVTPEQLLDLLRRLPSFHRASFVPTLLG
jgi:hypothetical protein